MYGKKIMQVTVLAVVLALAGNAAAVTAHAEEANILIGNGTGGKINRLILIPAGDTPESMNCFGVQNIQVDNGDIFGLVLPGYMKDADTFDIEVVSNGIRYMTHQAVKIDFSKGIPVLELSGTLRKVSLLIPKIITMPFHSSYPIYNKDPIGFFQGLFVRAGLYIKVRYIV